MKVATLIPAGISPDCQTGRVGHVGIKIANADKLEEQLAEAL